MAEYEKEYLSLGITRFFVTGSTIKRFIDVKNKKSVKFGCTALDYSKNYPHSLVYWRGPDRALRDFHKELVSNNIIKESFKG